MFAPDRLSNLCPDVKKIPSQHAIRKAIDEKTKALQEIELARERLALQEKQLLKEVNEQRALISPISRIPVEIISRIFSMCISLDSIGLPATEAINEIYNLMLVCKYWCIIAVETPQMWTSYELTPGIDIPYLPTWLRRSGDLPLSVQIPIIGCSHVPLPTKALGSHFSRMSKLCIAPAIPTEVVGVRFRSLFCGIRDFGHLTELQINLTDIVEPYHFATGWSCIKLPHLRVLFIDRSIMPFAIVSPVLEELEITACVMFTEHVWAMVKVATKLWRLAVCGSSIQPGNVSKGNIGCQLPNVRTTFFAMPAGDDQRCYRNLLHMCSNNKDLSLTLKHNGDFMNTISPHIFKKLTRLDITLVTATDEWLGIDQTSLDRTYPVRFGVWFSHCDNLEELSFRFLYGGLSTSQYDASLILQSILLGAPSQSKRPCPRLRKLVVQGHAMLPSVFLRFMLERAASPAEIKEAGFDPKNFRELAGRPEPFEIDLGLRLLQKAPGGGYEFQYCEMTSSGWKEFYLKFRKFYTAEDEDAVTQLGSLASEDNRLSYIYKRLKMLRRKCKTRIPVTPGEMAASSSMGPFGNPFIENPMMENFCKAFEEALGLNDMTDEEDEDDMDEDEDEDGDEDEGEGEDHDEGHHGGEEAGNGSTDWETEEEEDDDDDDSDSVD